MKYVKHNIRQKFVRFIIYSMLVASFSYANKVYPKQGPIDILFHGSSNKNINTFKPQSKSVRDKSEGAVIFATPYLRLASCFLFQWDDSWVQLVVDWDWSSASDNVVMVISDKERFLKEDKGGAIYMLSAKDFSFDPQKGMGVYEWISKEEQAYIHKIQYSSALEAMKKAGVKVYFLTTEKFNEYKSLNMENQRKFLLQCDTAV